MALALGRIKALEEQLAAATARICLLDQSGENNNDLRHKRKQPEQGSPEEPPVAGHAADSPGSATKRPRRGRGGLTKDVGTHGASSSSAEPLGSNTSALSLKTATPATSSRGRGARGRGAQGGRSRGQQASPTEEPKDVEKDRSTTQLAEDPATSCPHPIQSSPVDDKARPPPPVVTDPRVEHLCYDALDVHRTAPPEAIRRAFKRRALAVHPDKPGGDHKAFLCVNAAFEVLNDASLRESYNLELTQIGSRDGENGQAAATFDSGPIANASMLRDACLAADTNTWPDLLAMLTDVSLSALVNVMLRPPPAASLPKIDRSVRSANTPGLVCKSGKYAGKLTLDNFIILSWLSTELTDAIEGRIALASIKEMVTRRQADGETFDDSMRAAVKEVRVSMQASAFYLGFQYELRTGTGKGTRFTTPKVVDLDVALLQRQTLLDLVKARTPSQQIVSAHKGMLEESREKKRAQDKSKNEFIKTLCRKARVELARRGGHAAAVQTKLVKVVGTNKVAILMLPDVDADVSGYLKSGSEHAVSIEHISGGRRYFQLASGEGWVPEYSRKNITKKIIEHASGAEAQALCDMDAKANASDESDSDSSSSSSSSSSGSDSDVVG